ncbi:MAG: T9SS type A sorting domain-containing protein [Candidatus Stygibacter australis]|nr:T9SS type A sorting domain-containing protein [Candidatus Stygibacter australis]MDP8321791.1 T9SS type A sorting domain-containing protein [Candidatus Stygibacter australis]
MKKTLIILVFIGLVTCLFSADFPVDTKSVTPVDSPFSPTSQSRISRNVPEWEWATEPVGLLSSYYDYFHAYTSIPMASQPDDHGGGLYLTYRTAESTGAVHQLSYSYVDANGNVTTSAGVGCEGRYGDCDVDPETGDVFVSYHQVSSNVIFLYDLYHIIGTPGLWLDPPYTLLDLEVVQNDGTYPFDDDEFVWPKVNIGPSPLPDHRRVYVIPMNSTSAHGSQADPSENVVICYADFTTADLEMQSNLEWSFRTIEQMDVWNAGTDGWSRPQVSMEIHDNVVILMGYLAHDLDQPDDLLVLMNENYGEGPFEMYTQVATFDQENPSYIEIPSDSLKYLFGDIVEFTCKQDIIHSGHFNLVWNENYSTISFSGSMGITFDSGSGPGYYYPGWNQIYPKRWTFDLTSHSFGFQDIYPKGANPNDDMPMQPWDLNEDGIYDSTYDDGMPMWFEDWPIYYHDPDQAFHMNETFTVSNQEMGWEAMLWLDGTNSKNANDGYAGYEGWESYLEIAVVVSEDYGQHWSEPFFINAKSDDVNYSDAIDGMIPVYMYPGDEIEVIDAENLVGRINLLFYDDEDFGSFVNGNAGLANGGTYQYAALDVTFYVEPDDENDENTIPSVQTLRAYPNPYVPGISRAGITVEYDSRANAPAEVSVYNIRGQKVADLYNGNLANGEKLSVTWNAENCAAGIYFFRLNQAGNVAVTKAAVIK